MNDSLTMGSTMGMSRSTETQNVPRKPKKSFIQNILSKCNRKKASDEVGTFEELTSSPQPTASAPAMALATNSDNEKKTDKTKHLALLMNNNNSTTASEHGDPNEKSSNQVENSWKFIESWIKSKQQEKHQRPIFKSSWKTIRVFVSSTFTDMHNEREILVKKVFHKLRQWCEERKFNLVECDLRWGVPKDSTSTTTITVCLEELDRCIEENDDKPFFICTIGERYGWIPKEDEVNEEIRNKYDWVPNVSITHMEILHGAYRLKNPNALFCFREPDFLKNIPDKYKNKFVDEEDLSVQQLMKLKEKLKCQFTDQYFDYSCEYSHLDMTTGREKVFINIPETFESKVYDFLTKAILRQYPDNETSKEFTNEEQDDFSHNSFLILKSNFVVGRKDELKSIMKFIDGHYDDYKDGDDVSEIGSLTLKKREEGEEEDDDGKNLRLECERFNLGEHSRRLLCIYGETGVGKCTIVSQVGRHLLEKNRKVFYHNVTCSTNGMNWNNVLHRMIRFLSNGNFQEINEENSMDFDFLTNLLSKSLMSVTDEVVMIIYGVEKMENHDATDCLAWLPPRFPRNVKVIVCVDSKHYICNHRLRNKDPFFLNVDFFSEGDADEFIREYLLKFNKKLDADQTKSLLMNESSRSPIWLSIVCEELRIFGDFATLTNKIKSFPSDLKHLLKEVIERLLREDDTKLLNKLLCLLVSSHSGLPESEMLKLLGDPAKDVEIPMVTWATLKSYLKPFLTMTSSCNGKVVKVKLSYDAFIEVLKSTLLTEESSKEWHKYLADFYEFYNKDDYYIDDDLPHNFLHSGLWKRMADFYRTNTRTFAMHAILRSKILQPIRCTRMVNKNIPSFTYPVMACMNCSFRSKVISPTAHQTKELCLICGSWVAFKKPDSIAHLCQNHGFNFKNKCFFCQMPIMSSPHDNAHKLKSFHNRHAIDTIVQNLKLLKNDIQGFWYSLVLPILYLFKAMDFNS
ncbi:hypothetical protein HELRODRAFT_193832 [Helobdella robusta]|uniref:DUF4062 domain-containing protein n=1 Tax=Helobdella robusta TaxID=6412 RepID=T1FVE5_HELRO|nr:hypothetical protein HELRODRAFT_193832 [Helobdella robusta]ESN94094.1 hypothetical protein HELRODRAFT_193832 [Helobdella robusta]